MPSYSGSSSRHLPTRLLQLCPLRPAFIHTPHYTLYPRLYAHCCSSYKRSQSERPHHAYTETTALTFHPRPYCFQNLPLHVSYSLWNFNNFPSYIMSCVVTPCCVSSSRELRSSTREDFAVIRKNLKFWQSCFLGLGT